MTITTSASASLSGTFKPESLFTQAIRTVKTQSQLNKSQGMNVTVRSTAQVPWAGPVPLP